jgi:hypothetical protein
MKIDVSGKHTIFSSPMVSVTWTIPDEISRTLTNFFAPFGNFQKVLDQTFLDEMIPYMPFRTGGLVQLTRAQTVIGSGLMVTEAPQAGYLYNGMLFVDPITGKGGFYNDVFGFWSRPGVSKVPTQTPLNFYQGEHPLAGPRWDQNMWADRGGIITSNMQAYIDMNLRL